MCTTFWVTATSWIPHEVHQWHCYKVAQTLLDRYQREDDDFLGRIVAMDESWASSYEPHLKRQSNEWKLPGSPRPKKVCRTQCAEKVMFIVTYYIDGVILHHSVHPRQMANAACYCTFLQHHHRPALRKNEDTWWYKTPSFYLKMQGVTPLVLSRTSCAAGKRRFWNIPRTHPI